MGTTTDKIDRPLRRSLAAAILFLAVYLGLSGWEVEASGPTHAKNIILLLGDGMAAPQLELGQATSHHLRGQPFIMTDTLFKEGTVGLMTTHAQDATVTDSAAAGSAMSTGVKTTLETIAMTPDGRAMQTAMEAAKVWGKRIGLVTTATVYDATPAAFSVHARTPRDYQALVDQYLALEPDVILGGGSNYFLPRGTQGGRRNDGRDMIGAFQAKGYQVARNVLELRAATGPRLLGLFAEQDMSHEIDRDSSREPSIAEMAQAAIRILSRGSPQGFVLLLETENTDTAGHRHDIAALIGDLWAFDRAVQFALQFQRRTLPETLLLVTGDHETGGLTLTEAVQDLRNTSSRAGFARDPVQWEMLHRLIKSVAKVAIPGKTPTAEALDQLIAERFPGFHLHSDLRRAFLTQPLLGPPVNHPLSSTLALGTSRQLTFSWSTSGHSAQPVRLGAVGPGAELFQGLLDNTDFGKILHRLIKGQPAD